MKRAWTESYLAFVLPLTAEEVLQPCTGPIFGGSTPASRREWTWIQTAQRLVWCWGFAEALRRLQAYGTDGQTRAAA